MKPSLLSLVAAGVLLRPFQYDFGGRFQGHAGQQKPAELDRTGKVRLKHLIDPPKNYDRKDSWPVLLFLHGIG